MQSLRVPSPLSTIGIFDSGVGGLSVLRALRRRLPGAWYHYVADSLYAPYGELPLPRLLERSRLVTEHLLRCGAGLIVVACNTATTAAIRTLRDEWPEVPFVGVEPGVKPAAALSMNKRVGVLATPRTIGSERLRHLIAEHAVGVEVHLQACPGLADAIEQGRPEDEVRALVQAFCEPLLNAGVDAAVLGCTHYPLIRPLFEAALGPAVRLIDTADAVAERARAIWTPRGEVGGSPALRLETTGSPATLSDMAQRFLGETPSIRQVEIEPIPPNHVVTPRTAGA